MSGLPDRRSQVATQDSARTPPGQGPASRSRASLGEEFLDAASEALAFQPDPPAPALEPAPPPEPEPAPPPEAPAPTPEAKAAVACGFMAALAQAAEALRPPKMQDPTIPTKEEMQNKTFTKAAGQGRSCACRKASCYLVSVFRCLKTFCRKVLPSSWRLQVLMAKELGLRF